MVCIISYIGWIFRHVAKHGMNIPIAIQLYSMYLGLVFKGHPNMTENIQTVNDIMRAARITLLTELLVQQTLLASAFLTWVDIVGHHSHQRDEHLHYSNQE